MAWVLRDYWNTWDDTNRDGWGVNWMAQTFKTTSSYQLWAIKLLMYQYSNPWTMTVTVHAVDGSSKPTWAALATWTIDADTFTTDSAWEWYEIDMTWETPALLAGWTEYAIVVNTKDVAYASGKNRWRVDTSSWYADWLFWVSSDSGSTWSNAWLTTYDAMFEVYGYASSTLVEDLKLYYKMDIDWTITDSAGSYTWTNNWADFNATWKINGWYDFVTANTDYIDTNFDLDTELSDTAIMTTRMWFKLWATNIAQYLVGSSSAYVYWMRFNPDGSTFNLYCDGSSRIADSWTQDTDWHHLVIVNDKTNLKVYIDTVEVWSVAYSWDIGDGELFLWNNGTGSAHATATIDEFGVRDRALTTDEIAEDYNSGNGLTYDWSDFIDPNDQDLLEGILAYWKADTNWSFPDSSGNEINGTITWATYDSSGKIEGCYSLDGSNDNIALTNWSTKTNVKSLSMRVYIDSTGSYNGNTCIFSDIADAGNFTTLRIYETKLQITLSSPSYTNAAQDITDYSEDARQHIVITVDWSDIKVYVNWIYRETDNTDFPWIFEANNTLYLWYNSFDSAYAKIKVDEIAFYDRTLSDWGVSIDATAWWDIAKLYNDWDWRQYPFEGGEEVSTTDFFQLF